MQRRLFIVAILVLMFLLPARANAQACSRIQWDSSSSSSFVFTYQDSLPLGSEIAARFGTLLDEEFVRFANFFETSLPVPVMVRLYPTEREYYCFNALAPQIPLGQTHSHIGSREISLIAENILDDREAWQEFALDAFRYELAILYLNQISADKAPAGLQIGLGLYRQDPFINFERNLLNTNPPTAAPSASWRSLWEAPDLINKPGNRLQTASITAFLIDVYGWNQFLQFLEALRTAESWRLALDQVYPASPNALETQWAKTYYQVYMQGRWQENIFYRLSLDPFEQLISVGAYQAALDGLEEKMPLLIDQGNMQGLENAELLKDKAIKGLEADALARQARQAYLEGDYIAAASFANEAINVYESLGDIRNLEKLDQIEILASEVIELREELSRIQSLASGWSASLYRQDLLEIGTQLQSLGDNEGAILASNLLDEINSSRQSLLITTASFSAVVSILLLYRRFRHMKKTPPVEVKLQS